MKLSNVSFEEKSIWASLLILLFVYSGYFSQVYEGLISNSLSKVDISVLFIGTVITIVFFQIVFQIIMAISNSKDADQPSDERDRLFAMKAGNVSGWVLGSGVIAVTLLIFAIDLNSLWTANLLLFSMVVSQAVCYILQLFYYRRGY